VVRIWPADLSRFAAPSAAAAAAAAVAAGLVEGALQRAPLAVTLCAAGAAALYTGPALFLVSLALRGLWRSWRSFDVDGPRLFGGAVYAALAVFALGAVGFAASYAGLAGRPSAELSSPAIAAALAAAAAVLLAASRPAVLGLARIGRALGLRRARSGLLAVIGLAAIMAAAIWFGVAGPALAKVDYDYAGYGWTALVVLVAGHAAARLLRARLAGGAAALAWVGLVGFAFFVRARDPATLFDAWYRMPVGGLALGLTYDVDELRGEILPADLTPRARPGASHPDIALLTIDTVRADRLRLYGGDIDTPNLARAAARGSTFDWAFAPSNNTRQSISSIMTGLSPSRLRGRVVEFGLKLDPRHVVLGERFRAAGYATAGFLCCPNHMGGRKKIGLDRGLERVDYERRGERLVQLATAWLRQSAGEARPRYFWLHLFEPHDWKRQSPGEDPAASYRRAVEGADALLRPVIEAIEASGRPTIIVLASDHGEGLGDHRALHHASNLYNSQIRVPLVIAGPGLPAGRRLADPTALLDLAPTLLDLAGFEPPAMPAMDARSFAPLLRGDPGSGEAYAVMVRDRSVARSGRALIAGRFKLIAVDGRRAELYDLVADPAEAKNLASRKPPILADLMARMARRQAADEVSPF
jgi:arylsulfatase A-like enzyme